MVPPGAARLVVSSVRWSVVFFVCLVVFAVWLLVAGTAAAQQMPQNSSGEVDFRGNYWRDRNTRVINPTVEVRRDLPSGVSVGASYLLDAITSASVGSGASADQPFTELRHEASLNAKVPISRQVSIRGHYSYSSESDYWSHNAGLRLQLDLLQDNTTLVFGVDYGHNDVAKRVGTTGYLAPPPDLSKLCSPPPGPVGCQGVMHSAHGLVLWNQILTPRLFGTLSYELTVLDGYQNNVYRNVFVAGEAQEVENLPMLRVRHVLAASAHQMVLLKNKLVPHLSFRPAFRYHTDSWGLNAFNPELATYVPFGPFEFRVMFSYYRQYGVVFYRSDSGGRVSYFADTPGYNAPVPFGGDPQVYTSDVKLGSYSTYTPDLQVRWRLSVLHGLPWLGDLMARSIVELGAGMWLADRAVGWQYGIPLSGGDPQAPAGCSKVCGAYFGSLGLFVPL